MIVLEVLLGIKVVVVVFVESWVGRAIVVEFVGVTMTVVVVSSAAINALVVISACIFHLASVVTCSGKIW